LADYDPRWPELFEDETRRIFGVTAGVIVAIEHVGSTAVPGLAAKPIIDLMAGLRRLGDASRTFGAMETLGYEYVPQYETSLPERRYFRKPRVRPRTHHVHMVEVTSEFWNTHLLFRDFLRAYPEVAREYAALKQTLGDRYGDDGLAYTNAKTPFIESALARARLSRRARSAEEP
jgi:GrpB-like predicted nucleotidyltransferase (UPF0157 family)